MIIKSKFNAVYLLSVGNDTWVRIVVRRFNSFSLPHLLIQANVSKNQNTYKEKTNE